MAGQLGFRYDILTAALRVVLRWRTFSLYHDRLPHLVRDNHSDRVGHHVSVCQNDSNGTYLVAVPLPARAVISP